VVIYIEAPNHLEKDVPYPSLFIAGGITNCREWQTHLCRNLSDMPLVIYNPRKKNFPIDDPNAAYEQIRWEYDNLRKADFISFWFCRDTLCPITLYELGAQCMFDKPVLVGMDPEYERRQDVEIQTSLVRPDIRIVYNLNDLAEQIKVIMRSF